MIKNNSNPVKVGGFGLVIPNELWYKVATLEIDLRPAITALQEATPKPHVHQFRKYYGRVKCKCGLIKERYARL